MDAAPGERRTFSGAAGPLLTRSVAYVRAPPLCNRRTGHAVRRGPHGRHAGHHVPDFHVRRQFEGNTLTKPDRRPPKISDGPGVYSYRIRYAGVLRSWTRATSRTTPAIRSPHRRGLPLPPRADVQEPDEDGAGPRSTPAAKQSPLTPAGASSLGPFPRVPGLRGRLHTRTGIGSTCSEHSSVSAFVHVAGVLDAAHRGAGVGRVMPFLLHGVFGLLWTMTPPRRPCQAYSDPR